MGDVVLREGKIIKTTRPCNNSICRLQNVKVYKKPKIGVITTGSELVMPRPDISGAEVINSNHYTFKAFVESAMAIPTLVHCIDSQN